MGLNLRISSERIKVPGKKDQERNFLIERGNPRIAKNGFISTDFPSGKLVQTSGTKELSLNWGGLQRATAEVQQQIGLGVYRQDSFGSSAMKEHLPTSV
ncbi:MAG: hypothetical protein LW824_12230 [Algoriphagus sp.]|jgi:hypothetical protein|nr:hypothetical protein [Algoriphagus sp.]MCE2778354.1 hypothetical protein [Algoriphagus sp.]